MSKAKTINRLRAALHEVCDCICNLLDTTPETAEINHLSSDSDVWLPAIPENELTEEFQQSRAERVLNDLPEVAGKRVLDFGCGDGYLLEPLAAAGATKVVGYDLNVLSVSNDVVLATNDWLEVCKHGPFDLIILNDVLDHTVDPQAPLLDPGAILSACKQICSGEIFVRCHPWTSRDGGHVSHQMNKAWIHLYYTNDERLNLAMRSACPVSRITKPHATYEKWFRDVGLSVVRKSVCNDSLPEVRALPQDVLDKMIANTWPEIDREQAIRILGIDEIIFVLR